MREVIERGDYHVWFGAMDLTLVGSRVCRIRVLGQVLSCEREERRVEYNA